MRTIADIFRSHSVLDANGRHINGTDKQTNHNYGDAYESLFPDRSAVKLMLEIGITDGSSMLAWREVFQEALVVGMDIEPCSCERGPRLEFHRGDFRNREECERTCGGRQFDFICEDATHQLADTLCALLYLWPFVKPGGVYVVEEFANIGMLRLNIMELFGAVIVDTVGPFGGVESLTVFKKPN